MKLEYENHSWLPALKIAIKELEKVEEDLDRSKRELKRWVEGDLAHIKLNAESKGAHLEEIIMRLEFERFEKETAVFDIECWLKYFGTDLSNRILYMKHIEGYTLEKIACKLNYATAYVGNCHARAMKLIKETKLEKVKD